MCQHTRFVSVTSKAVVSTAPQTASQPVNQLTYGVDCKKCGNTCSNGRKCPVCGTKN
jgi:rubrerythrin